MSALAQQFPIDDSVAAAAAYMRDRLLTSLRLTKERPVTARCTPLHPVTLTLP